MTTHCSIESSEACSLLQHTQVPRLFPRSTMDEAIPNHINHEHRELVGPSGHITSQRYKLKNLLAIDPLSQSAALPDLRESSIISPTCTNRIMNSAFPTNKDTTGTSTNSDDMMHAARLASSVPPAISSRSSYSHLQVPATFFPRFLAMPEELQLHILRFILFTPRFIEVRPNCRNVLRFHADQPALMQVCRRIRYAFLNIYPQSFRLFKERIYVNPWVDTIVVHDTSLHSFFNLADRYPAAVRRVAFLWSGRGTRETALRILCFAQTVDLQEPIITAWEFSWDYKARTGVAGFINNDVTPTDQDISWLGNWMGTFQVQDLHPDITVPDIREMVLVRPVPAMTDADARLRPWMLTVDVPEDDTKRMEE